MTKPRFLMVGGFLGAGKTTALARLARHYMSRGRRVGLVTNDQAQDLVDTNSLRSQGFTVAEVAGACFCCRFNDLVERARELQDHERPDVILAEPVGSCTDLVATVVQPLKDIYGQRFQVAPYAVLFKPSHGLRILRDEPSAGFSPKAAYIFRKQLEEADAIVINRIDELPPADLAELAELLEKYYPSAPVLRVSAKTGQGFDGLTEFLDQDGDFGRRILDIDYDAYAAGEAELGWLNSSVHMTFPNAAALDELLLEIVERLRAGLNDERLETAHLKAIGLCDNTFGVANLVSSLTAPELSLPSRANVADAEIIVNARVATDPQQLESLVRRVIEEACRRRHGKMEMRTMQSFRPGRPQPTHRYAEAKSHP